MTATETRTVKERFDSAVSALKSEFDLVGDRDFFVNWALNNNRDDVKWDKGLPVITETFMSVVDC